MPRRAAGPAWASRAWSRLTAGDRDAPALASRGGGDPRRPHAAPWARFSRNVAYGIVGRAAQWSASLFLLAYVIRRLGPERFALVVTATSLVAFIGLVQLGASSGLAKQLASAHARDPERLFRRYFTAALVLSWGLGLLVAAGVGLALALPPARWNVPPALAGESRLVLAAIGAAAVCSCLRLPADGALQAVHRIDLAEKASLLGLAARALGVGVAFGSGQGSAVVYAAILAGEAALVLGFSVAAARSVVPTARAELAATPRHVVAEVLRFNLLTFFDSLNYVLFMQGPVLVIQAGAGLVAAGWYGILLQLNNAVRGFSLPVSTALSPVAMSLEAQHERAELRAVFLVATRGFVAAGLLLWVNGVVLGAPFLSLWLRREVAPLLDALPWLLAASAIGVATLPAALFLVALRRVRVPAISGLLLALGLLATLALSIDSSAAPLQRAAQRVFAFFAAYQLLRLATAARALRIGAAELARAVSPALLPVAASAGALAALHAWAPPIASWGGLLGAASASAAAATFPMIRLAPLAARRGRALGPARSCER